MSSNSSRSSGYGTNHTYNTSSHDRRTGASERRRRPLHSNSTQEEFDLPRRQNYDPWLAEAKRTLLRRQADFFNRAEGRGPVNNTKNIDEELKQALRNTRANVTRAEKREIRRWAIEHHIHEVLQKTKHPMEGREMLDRHMKALMSLRDDDGGDSMYLLQGLSQFSLASRNRRWRSSILSREIQSRMSRQVRFLDRDACKPPDRRRLTLRAERRGAITGFLLRAQRVPGVHCAFLAEDRVGFEMPYRRVADQSLIEWNRVGFARMHTVSRLLVSLTYLLIKE